MSLAIDHDDDLGFALDDKPKLSAPEPLVRPLALGTPYPLDCLPAILADGVKGILAKTQCPIGLAANSVLAAAALASQGHINVPGLGGSCGPVSLFVLTVAQSGERKSSADALAMRPIKDWEKARMADAKQADETYRRAKLAFDEAEKAAIASAKEKTKKNGGGSAREAINQAVADVGEPPTVPIRPNLICDEPTAEGLWMLLSEGLGSAGVFSAEGGAFVGGHAMSSDNKLKSAALFSQMWDGEALRRVRVSGVAAPLYGRRVSMHLMGQPEAMAGFASDPTLRDQGLLARFLWSEPISTMGTRLQHDVSPEDEAALARYQRAVGRCLDRPIPRDEDDERACAPVCLELGALALPVIKAFADDVERQLAPGAHFATITGTAAKLAEQALRIAGIFTFISNPDATAIDFDTMRRACTLALWYGEEALRFFNAGAASPEIAKAESLRVWLLAQAERDVARGKILTHGPSRVRDAKEVSAALKVLSESGWVFKSQERPEVWRVYRGDG